MPVRSHGTATCLGARTLPCCCCTARTCCQCLGPSTASIVASVARARTPYREHRRDGTCRRAASRGRACRGTRRRGPVCRGRTTSAAFCRQHELRRVCPALAGRCGHALRWRKACLAHTPHYRRVVAHRCQHIARQTIPTRTRTRACRRARWPSIPPLVAAPFTVAPPFPGVGRVAARASHFASRARQSNCGPAGWALPRCSTARSIPHRAAGYLCRLHARTFG